LALNEEDRNLWSAIETFDFDDYGNMAQLRVELFKEILKKIGTCSQCASFVKSNNYCKTLKITTGAQERCSDFDSRDEETETPFAIMNEDHMRQQEYLKTMPLIKKYVRMPTKPHKEEAEKERE
jgi:hypothetical protein